MKLLFKVFIISPFTTYHIYTDILTTLTRPPTPKWNPSSSTAAYVQPFHLQALPSLTVPKLH